MQAATEEISMLTITPSAATKVTKNDLLNGPVVIRSFFEPHEVEAIIEVIKNNYDNSVNNFVPYRFPNIDWTRPGDFSAETEKFNRLFADVLLTRFRQKLKSLLADFSIEPVQNDAELVFNQLTVRILQPEQMDINQHCENQAVSYCPKFFGLLDKQMEIWNHRSLLLMLQKPETGGDVVIYKQKWTGEKDADGQRDYLIAYDKEHGLPNENVVQIISLNPGDLLTFEAGNTWHKVSEAYGAVPRITVGGFMGLAKNSEDKYLYFS